jgi:mRNA interferase ChpB
MAYVPNRGDIIHIEFDPARGREMRGDHYALVITQTAFNKSGLALVCPISQGAAQMARSQGVLVTLMGTGTATQGAIHCHQLKSLDWQARKARLRETVPDFVVDDVIDRMLSFIDPEG